MARIEKTICGGNRVSVTFNLQDSELNLLEAFRKRTEDWLRKNSSVPFPECEEYTLDNSVMYIIGEVLSGRARYIDLDRAFTD